MVEVKIWLEPSQSNFGAFLFHARAKLTQVLLFGAFSEYVGALSNQYYFWSLFTSGWSHFKFGWSLLKTDFGAFSFLA